MNVFLVNESTVLTEAQAFNTAWALNYQATYHFGRSGWRSDVRCFYAPGGASAKIPVGTSILHLLDTSDQPGALGYHDEDGNEVPYARVFVKTIGVAGVPEVASHELCELAADPNVNLCALTGDQKRLYAVEVGDPVQGNPYDVGAPQGRTTGIKVADFTLPSYYDPRTQPGAKTSFRGSVSGPFSIAPQGYYSYLDLTNVAAGWQQSWGAARSSAPPAEHDDRLEQRLSTLPQAT